MRLTLRDNTINKYFDFLNKFDNSTKKKLIIKLTKSIKIKKSKEFNLKSICGTWEDSRDSDEIIMDIKKSRFNKPNSVDL